jgi:hypothetical protein
MKTPFQFEVSVNQGLHTYLYVAGDNPIVTKNWPGIIEEWLTTTTPFSEFNVNNNNAEEMSVYLGFVWQLCEEKPSYAIPNYYRDEAKQLTGLDFDLVKWEYEIEADQPGLAVDRGFIHATACTHILSSDWESKHKDQAGLFRIDSFERLVLLQRATLGDAASEISLFCIPSERKTALLHFLNSDQCPILADFLKPGELFVDIGVGVDRGYYDSILIKSVTDIEDRLQNLVQQYTQAITDYEGNVSNLKTMEDALQAMTKLALGKLYRSIILEFLKNGTTVVINKRDTISQILSTILRAHQPIARPSK